MATIIDALVVTLGLEGKTFVRDAEEAVKIVEKTKERTKKAGAEVTESDRRQGKERADIVRKEGAAREEAGKKVALGLSQLRNQALAVAAVFTAGMGLKNFIANTIASAAGLDRMSARFGMQTKSLAAFKLANVETGGSAEGMAAQIQKANEQIARYDIEGIGADHTEFLRRGGNAEDMKSAESLMYAQADILKGLYEKSPRDAALSASNMGISEDVFMLFIKGGEGMRQAAKAQEGLAKAQADAAKPAEALRKQFNTFEKTIESVSVRVLTALLPSFEKIVRQLQYMGDWFVANKDRINDWVTRAANGIEKFVEWADKAAKSVGGWQNVLLALGGLKILSIVSPFVSLASALASIATSLGTIGGAAGGAGVAALGGIVAAAGGIALAAYSKPTNEGEAETLAAMNSPLARSAKAHETVKKFEAMGWTRDQAIGIVANLQQESSFNPSAVGDGGKAYGLAQWHPDRQAKFKAAYGFDIRQSTYDQQLAFIDLELRTNEKRAGDRLRAATNPQDAAKIVSTHYERPDPKKTEKEELTRAGNASAIFAEYYRRERGGAGPISMGKIIENAGAYGRIDYGRSTTSNSNETTIGQIIVNTQATDAKGIARGIGGALSENPLVGQTNNGMN